ncbi:MAG: DNA repair protein RadA [Candidatus Omnitrophica bacterium]|nr:DNA repair protein RadA [Candidatus Omnitrophota bacterium]HOX53927.1 DNA repair protein RadA [Candidatus Omnitrophota bacterium]
MTKVKSIFVCQNCGTQSPKWMGKCANCGSWNSYVEEAFVPEATTARAEFSSKENPVLLSEIEAKEESRIKTSIEEFDRVLGGGIVPGSVVLVGGDPGIGKSTISLQISCLLSQAGHRVLYISGEESVKQTKLRANRLQTKSNENLYIVNQIDLNLITEYIKQLSPEVVIIDSIQVVYLSDISSSPGSVGQVRECAAILTQLAKSMGIAMFIIGHVTKEGSLAGPKVLEHIVDTVLYFEGERYSVYRILRAVKNRFGSTNEIGVFEMAQSGLLEVKNPSEIFLSERVKQTSGSAVVAVLEGSRPILVEIQALVSKASFGFAKRRTQGIDYNRVSLLVAVLEKRLKMDLSDKDIFVNVAGGVKVEDPAADLAVIIAIASALKDRVIPAETVLIGEVGLAAEVRSVSQIDARINEVQKLGFKRCFVPKNNLKNKKAFEDSKIEIVPVYSAGEVLELL